MFLVVFPIHWLKDMKILQQLGCLTVYISFIVHICLSQFCKSKYVCIVYYPEYTACVFVFRININIVNLCFFLSELWNSMIQLY